ncbi:Crp/Fnr family transcriptional regulator [Mycobacterium intracellulare]|uniref:Crp/Fnr family transcriptional regulator n=1 Tax=Mycobacterium intracellulare TaxID=1767 RepID=A0AAE4UDN5_MYCIT|nr:Crp/Fnr family transcriptional regulator [Mycobacterium intracellulare]MDV6979290.1 Crp/Fnr family transcriptional regulator [Mycobacterium intracellulare]MDV6984743.1 Crp/Fnr family transcriptional regulator [Mycobacterium intracellulare]MDV7014847.1 Crp/Fnr family transcriptional regulator [Mycobacterium intracellulare]MDV7031016.1 Crp/Fnr family transcriptional regulator [Mycobacterium intracellulare]
MTDDPLRRNAILAQLPDREFDALKLHLRVESAEMKHSAYEPHTPIKDIYFPLSSVFSLVAVADGRVILEVATIGHEGMVGLPVYLGATSSPQAAFCQVPGEAARISVEDFRRALSHDGVLHARLNRFTQATMVQIAQNVVCNSSHPTAARAARWLLTTQDRVGRNEFPLTQEFLAQMLGVHRPTVSEIAQRLQANNLIRYTRGVITIVDRAQLEDIACECYEIVKAEFDDIRNGH